MHALGAFVSAGLVIEAIVEDLDVKRKLLRELEVVVPPGAILASNTSSLSITALAAGLKHPGRVVGMHFFNPAPVLPLVEVVSGLATDAAVADTVYATALAWGKKPVHATSTPGFIVNRCARPFYAEALALLTERAADPATIDAVLREAGAFRMGAFELMDLIGHDVNLAVTKSVWEAYFHDPRYRPSVLQQERVAAGFLGRKSGRGIYAYGPSAGKPLPRTEPAQPRPARIAAAGAHAMTTGLRDRLAAAGFAIGNAAPVAALASAYLDVDGALLVPSDGRTATAVAAACGRPHVVVFDLAHDYGRCTRLAIAAADGCPDAAVAAVTGALQAAGIAVSRIDDVAGLVVMRTRRDARQRGGRRGDAGHRERARHRRRDGERRQLSARTPRVGGRDRRRPRRRGAAQPGRALRGRPLSHVAARRAPPRDRRPARRLNGDRRRMHEEPAKLTPAAAQALAERVAEGMYARDRASQGLGIRIVGVAPGAAELTMTVRGDMVNGHAICHGGFVFTLADSAFAYACNSYNANTVAAGCAIEFLAPSRLGDVLTARARERVLAGRSGIYDVDVTNQNDEPVAVFRGKSARIRGHVI